jgi:hypothetical protein
MIFSWWIRRSDVMTGKTLKLWLNHQQRALLERAVADGAAPSLEALVRCAIAESKPLPAGQPEAK